MFNPSGMFCVLIGLVAIIAGLFIGDFWMGILGIVLLGIGILTSSPKRG